MRLFLSGRPGSNRRHSAWKADALPTELLPLFAVANINKDFNYLQKIIISLKNDSLKFQNPRYNKICVTGSFERKYLIHK